MSPVLGCLIAGIFGLAYVLANAGALPSPLDSVLPVIAIAALVWLGVLVRRAGLEWLGGSRRRLRLGLGYWLVVMGEVGAIAAGSAVLNGPLDAPRGVVAWVSLVVGLHFVALAVAWREPVFYVLGAAIAACGVAALAAALAGGSDALVGGLGGVLPGLLLLTASLLAASRAALRR